MGRLISFSQIGDAIANAYGRGKRIFCAAGPSFNWSAGWAGVICPAPLPEAVAVTDPKSDLSTRCNECRCHTGADVEFAVVMQQARRRPLTLLYAMLTFTMLALPLS